MTDIVVASVAALIVGFAWGAGSLSTWTAIKRDRQRRRRMMRGIEAINAHLRENAELKRELEELQQAIIDGAEDDGPYRITRAALAWYRRPWERVVEAAHRDTRENAQLEIEAIDAAFRWLDQITGRKVGR